MPTLSSSEILNQKKTCAQKALSYVENNMHVGLGTGSTADIFIDLLADYVRHHNLNIQCVATSKSSQERAFKNGLTLLPDGYTDYLDISVDGADEFDPQFRLIKGGGGALLREKIIASATKHYIVIADESKAVKTLGNFPLPIECVHYETNITLKSLEKVFKSHNSDISHNFSPKIRKNKHNDNLFLTDLGHIIIDLQFNKISNPEQLAHDLHIIPGIVEHGLFLNETDTILTNNSVLNKLG